MSEAALWKYVRTRLLPVAIHATRIENETDSGFGGFPDIHYSLIRPGGTRSSGTIELKFLRKKKPPFGDDGLRLSQKIWIRDELAAGGLVWIIAEVGKSIYVVRGRNYKHFNEWTLEDFEDANDVVFQKGKPNRDEKAALALLL